MRGVSQAERREGRPWQGAQGVSKCLGPYDSRGRRRGSTHVFWEQERVVFSQNTGGGPVNTGLQSKVTVKASV